METNGYMLKSKKMNESGSGSYQYTTKIYYNDAKIFSCKEHKSAFDEVLPELFINSKDI